MRTGKAEGPDKIPAELLKLGGETVTGAMHKLITHVWITGNWPDDWTQSTFLTLTLYLTNCKVCKVKIPFSRKGIRQSALTIARYP